MKKLPAFILFSMLLAMCLSLEIVLPSTLAVPTAAVLSLSMGLAFHRLVERPFFAFWVLVAASFLVFGILFFLSPRILDRTTFYGFACLVAYSFFLGNSIPKKDLAINPNYFLIFILGWLAGFADSNFNGVQSLTMVAIGYAFIFGGSGIVFGKSKTGIIKQCLFLAPVIIVAILEQLGNDSPVAWFANYYLPMLAILSLIVGNFAARKNLGYRIAATTFVISMVTFTSFVIPNLIQSYSWTMEESNKELPNFQFLGLNGDTLHNQDLAGNVVWIDFYSTTCRPCILQMESTKSVITDFSNEQHVKFLSLATADYDSHERFEKATKFHQYPFWHGYDPDTILSKTFVPNGVPVGLLIDKKGFVRFRKEGFNDYEAESFGPELKSKIQALLKES